MSYVNGSSNQTNIAQNGNIQGNNKKNIDIEEIEFLFATEMVEDKRTDFDSTFESIEVSSKAVGGGEEDNEQARLFYQGLNDNKAYLCEKLGISEEKYDSLACVALALASQETGMGDEKGYQSENEGIGKFFRGVAKWVDKNIRGGMSASSGLTQMKIYEYINENGLPEDKKQILLDLGIQVDGITDNNLYSEPDKAAISTMVLLADLNENYDGYTSKLSEYHNEVASEISNDPEELEDAKQNGNEVLNKISTAFKTLPADEQEELRNAFKDVLLAKNDSTASFKEIITGGFDFNEEIQMKKFNKLLRQNGIDVEINSETLDNIRYALTEDGAQMNETEYLAYAWNKGTGETGMQLDRLLAAKVGTILSTEDNFDADQFESNVASLAHMYANQSVDENGIDYLNDALV